MFVTLLSTLLTTPPTTPLSTPLSSVSKFRLDRPTVIADWPRLCLSPDRRCSHDRTGRDLVSGDAVGRGSRGRGHLRRLARRSFDMMCRG